MKNMQSKSLNWLKSLQLGALAILVAIIASGCASRPKEIVEVKPDMSTGTVTTELFTLLKSVTNEASIGETVVYNYSILAKAKLKDVTLTDRVPAGSQLISSTPSASPQGDMLVWNLGTMMPGESKNVSLSVKATQPGTLASCAYVTAIPLACTETVIGQAKIAITKTGPSTAKVGQAVDFNVVINNPGNFVAKNVVVTDMIPDGLTHTQGSKLTFTVGELAPGASKSFVVPTVATKRGTHKNTAEVTTSNAGKANSDATVVVVKPALSITKTGTPEQLIGKQADYTVVAKNEGDTTLKNVKVTDTVPAPMRLLKAEGAQVSGNVATWTIASLGKGESKSFALTVGNTEAGSYTNSASVAESEDGLSATASATTLWKGLPALLTELVDSVDPILVGDSTTYTITVTNQGSAPDANVNVRVMFPEQLKPTSANGVTTGKIEGNVVTFAPVAVLASKQVVQWTIKAEALKTGDVRPKVEVTSKQIKTPVTQEESTQIY